MTTKHWTNPLKTAVGALALALAVAAAFATPG